MLPKLAGTEGGGRDNGNLGDELVLDFLESMGEGHGVGGREFFLGVEPIDDEFVEEGSGRVEALGGLGVRVEGFAIVHDSIKIDG